VGEGKAKNKKRSKRKKTFWYVTDTVEKGEVVGCLAANQK
jgi:hypothetical protein